MSNKKYNYSEIVKQDPILLLAPGINGNFGGMYNYVLTWLKHIKKYKVHYILFLKEELIPSGDRSNIEKKDFYSDQNQRIINLISILGSIFPTQFSSLFFKDYKEDAQKFKIIHILTSHLSAFLLVKALFKFNPKLKIIYTLHDPKSHDEKRSKIAKLIKNRFLGKLYKLSKSTENFFLHLHSERLIQDCPDYCRNIIIEPHPLPERLAVSNKTKSKKIRFGFLGRIEAYKGLSILFKAFKILESNISADLIEIIIIGRGDFNVKAWENDLCFDTLINNGMVSDIEFHEYMESLDCLILPYIKASQSGVGYMALAYEIPIIATETGGLSEIVDQSNSSLSTLVSPGDSTELSNAIKRVIAKIKMDGR